MPKVTINTDGSCHGNPGPGGFAAVVTRETGKDNPPTTTFTVVGGDPETTNNRMELSAVMEALRYLNADMPDRACDVTVRSDSKYIVDAFNQGWIQKWEKNGWRSANGTPVANADLWLQLLGNTQEHNITWEWVQGHAGDPMNEHCDRLANQQADNAPHMEGYWSTLHGFQKAFDEGVKEAELPFVPDQEEVDGTEDVPFGLDQEPEETTDPGHLALAMVTRILSAARRCEDPDTFLRRMKDIVQSLEDEGVM